MPGGWPDTIVGLVLLFLPVVVRAQAPTQQVSNLRFVDSNNDGGWISGTILWDPPANTAGIAKYVVVITNTGADGTVALPAAPGEFTGAWYLSDLGGTIDSPVGTNSMTIRTMWSSPGDFPRRGSTEVQPQTRRRYSWAGSTPPDRYMGVACVNAANEKGQVVFMPIYDKSSLTPAAHLDSPISFTDTNGAFGLLDGKISWTPSVQGDFTSAQSYNIYLANDAGGTNEVQIGHVTVPTFELNLMWQGRGSRDFIRIRGVNSNGISTWSLNKRFFDSGPYVPAQGVTQLSFSDVDVRQGWVQGTVTWTPPDDEAPIIYYKVFLSDQPGVGGIVTPASGYAVPVGVNQFVLPANVLFNAAEAGDPNYLQVYAVNDKGMQAVPTELAIEDRTEV